jgi:hypothetical protein
VASNGHWGDLAEADATLAAVYDGFTPIPNPGVNDALDAFCAAKDISRKALLRLGARLSDYCVIAYPFPGGLKFRNLETGQRWASTDAEFKRLKLVRSGAKRADTVIVTESETDACRLIELYPEVDVAILPAGARRFTPAFGGQLEPYGRVLAALDNDEAGNAGAAKIAEAVAHAQRFAPPEGHKDWCEYRGDAPPLPEPPAPPHEWWQAPTDFDFNDDPPEPDWLVDRTIERGTVTVLSGDTGAAKSIVTQALVVAALKGEDWLGRRTHIERIVVIDEENAPRLVHARLRALGLTNDVIHGRLRYFSRKGLTVGDGGSTDAGLRKLLTDFSADALIVDTLMSASALEDVNSNGEATRLMKFLRGLAEDFNIAVLPLHHERKRSKDNPSSSSQAMMGARQWAGQADAHMTLTVESDYTEEPAALAGHVRSRRTFKWRPAEKDRDGGVNRPRRIAVESEKDARGQMVWMTCTDEGVIDDPTAAETTADLILTALRAAGDTGLEPHELAKAAAEKDPSKPSGTYTRARKALEEAGRVEKVAGRWRVTADAEVPI